MNQTLTRLYSETVNATRLQFSRGELSMIIDIYNGTYLTGMTLDRGALEMQVLDSFSCYPGTYEEKWQVDKTAMIAKINVLPDFACVCLQIWANAYWYDHPGDLPDFDGYLKAPIIPIDETTRQAVALLEVASDKLEQTKGSFKSKLVAEARGDIAKAIGLLEK